MKKLLQNKRFILALIVVPNLIIAFLTNGNNALYTLALRSVRRRLCI